MVEESVTDEALLLAARTDADAFSQFYRRHAAPVLSYLVRRTRDPELGADLTAETFACALEGLARFDPERGSAVNTGARYSTTAGIVCPMPTPT